MKTLRQKCLKQTQQDYSDIKAKKYETLIVQIWELLPIFMRYNSPQLSSAFGSLLGNMEVMINKNEFGLRTLALKSFTEIINHCKRTPVVTD